MKKFLFIFLFLSFFLFIFSQDFKEDIKKFVDLLYTQQYEKTDIFLDSISKECKPILYYFLKTTFYSTYMSDFETDTLLDSFFFYSDLVKKVADIHNAFDNFYIGGIYLYRTYFYIDNGDYTKVIVNGFNALKYFDRSIEIDKKMYDSYLGKGVLSYFINKFKEKLPFVGTNEDGIKLIKFAADSGMFVKIPAYNVLSILYQMEKRYEKAESICKKLEELYPENRMILFTHIKILLEQEKYFESIFLLLKLKESVEIEQPKTYVNLSFVYYNLALANYNLKEYKNARFYIDMLNKVYSKDPHNKKVKEFYKKGLELRKKFDG